MCKIEECGEHVQSKTTKYSNDDSHPRISQGFVQTKINFILKNIYTISSM